MHVGVFFFSFFLPFFVVVCFICLVVVVCFKSRWLVLTRKKVRDTCEGWRTGRSRCSLSVCQQTDWSSASAPSGLHAAEGLSPQMGGTAACSRECQLWEEGSLKHVHRKLHDVLEWECDGRIPKDFKPTLIIVINKQLTNKLRKLTDRVVKKVSVP